MDAIPKTMGGRIRACREAKGLTQEQVGAACGVTKAAVSLWEVGHTANMKLQPFLKLLSVLDVTFEDIVFGDARSTARLRKPR